jgi:hypothetical protein
LLDEERQCLVEKRPPNDGTFSLEMAKNLIRSAAAVDETTDRQSNTLHTNAALLALVDKPRHEGFVLDGLEHKISAKARTLVVRKG